MKVLSINGTLNNQTSSSISLKIEGNNGVGIVGRNDILEIDGDLSLNVSILNDFIPLEIGEFKIITYTENLIDAF